MNRREFIAGLLSSSVAGCGFVAPVVAAPIPLTSVRDILLPLLQFGPWPRFSDVRDLNMYMQIVVDYENDCLWVNGCYPSKRKSAGFIIRRDRIETDLYKTEFKPNVLGLIECLKRGRRLI